MDIKDQPALVTGAASGMGAATARALAAAGARLTLIDLDGDAVAALAGELGATGRACDVSDARAAEDTVGAAREAQGPARILVNCAGIAPAQRIVSREGPMPLADFERVLRVNLVGSFNMMRLVAADLYGADAINDDGEKGVIVNTASVAAYDGQVGQAAYAASKGGLVSLTLQAAREFASQGIRVMTIAPGLVATPMLLGMPEEVQQSLAQQVPFPKRLGRPEEFASLVLQILANPMLNGEVIRLDGAIRMQPR